MDKYIQILESTRPKFVQLVDVECLIPFLASTKTLSIEDIEEIRAQVNMGIRVGKLLDTLLIKGRSGFRTLCLALETTYPHLLTLMLLDSQIGLSPLSCDGASSELEIDTNVSIHKSLHSSSLENVTTCNYLVRSSGAPSSAIVRSSGFVASSDFTLSPSTDIEFLLLEKSRLEQENAVLKTLREDDMKEMSELRGTRLLMYKEFLGSNSAPFSSDFLSDVHQPVASDELKKCYSDLAISYSEACFRIKLLENELDQTKVELEEVKRKGVDASNELQSLKHQCTNVIRKWDDTLRERNETRKQLGQTLQEFARSTKARTKLLHDLRQSTIQRNSILREYSLVMSERDQVHKEMEKLQEESCSNADKVTSLERYIKTLVDEVETLRREIVAALHDRDKAYKEVHELRERLGGGDRSETITKDVPITRDLERKEQPVKVPCKISESLSRNESLVQEKWDDLDKANQEIDRQKVILCQLESQITELRQEADVAIKRRDWAFKERDKVVMERDAQRTLCDKLRKERDNAVSNFASALRSSDDMNRQNREVSKELEDLKEKMELQSVNPFSDISDCDGALDCGPLSLGSLAPKQGFSHDSYSSCALWSEDEKTSSKSVHLSATPSPLRGSEELGIGHEPIASGRDSLHVTLCKEDMINIHKYKHGDDLRKHEEGRKLPSLGTAERIYSVKKSSNPGIKGLLKEKFEFVRGKKVSKDNEDSKAKKRNVRSTVQQSESPECLERKDCHDSMGGPVTDFSRETAPFRVTTPPDGTERTTLREETSYMPFTDAGPERCDHMEKRIAELDRILNKYMRKQSLSFGSRDCSPNKSYSSRSGTWPKYRNLPEVVKTLCFDSPASELDMDVRGTVEEVAQGSETFNESVQSLGIYPSNQAEGATGPTASTTSLDYSVKSGNNEHEVLQYYARLKNNRTYTMNDSGQANPCPVTDYHVPTLDYPSDNMADTSSKLAYPKESTPMYMYPRILFSPVFSKSATGNFFSGNALYPAQYHPPSQSMDLTLYQAAGLITQSHLHTTPINRRALTSSHTHCGTYPRKRTDQRIRLLSNAGAMEKTSPPHKMDLGSAPPPRPLLFADQLEPTPNYPGNSDVRNVFLTAPMRSEFKVNNWVSPEDWGFQIRHLDKTGVVVNSVKKGSVADKVGLRVGDQILEVCGINLRSADHGQASKVLMNCRESLNMLVCSLEKFQDIGLPENLSNAVSLDNSPDDGPYIDVEVLLMDPPDVQNKPRIVKVVGKELPGAYHIIGGNLRGIFIKWINKASLAYKCGLRKGDRVLEFNGQSMKGLTAEQACLLMADRKEETTYLVSFNFKKFLKLFDSDCDSLFIKSLVDSSETTLETTKFEKNSIMHITNTMTNGVLGNYTVDHLDEFGNIKMEGIVPSKCRIEEDLLMRRTLADNDCDKIRRSSTPARRSIFRRKKLNTSRDAKELASFSDVSINESNDIPEENPVQAYIRVERIIPEFARPLVLIGALSQCIGLKLVQDFPRYFQFPNTEKVNMLHLDESPYFVVSKDLGYGYCVSYADIKEIGNKNLHCVLETELTAIEDLHNNGIYPIVILIKFKSSKHIKETKEETDSTKMPAKIAKDLHERAVRMETEMKHLISATIQAGSNVSYISTQVKIAVEEQQKRPIFINSDNFV